MPPEPYEPYAPAVSASQLTSRWNERDERYRDNGRTLTLDETQYVMKLRQAEANALPLEERAAALREWRAWTPPVKIR